jgi:putative ABC transport system permease protein
MGLPKSGVGEATGFYFPILIAAIDPKQEAALLGLDRTIVSGRYLREGDRPYVVAHGRVVPAIVSTHVYADDELDVTVERLKPPASANVPKTLASRRAFRFVTGLSGRVIGHIRVRPPHVYAQLIRGTAENRVRGEIGGANYWTASDVRYRKRVRPLAPLPTRNPWRIWKSPRYFSGYAEAPPDNLDPQFRRLRPHAASNLIVGGVVNGAGFRVVGRYDPRELPEFSPLSRVPLETYYPPLLEPANAASKAALGGKPLLPTQNLGDYIAQPPLLLTTLAGIRPFLNPKWYAGASPEAPISAIRIKVAGVKGPDPLSRERIRVVAQKIREETGLEVDVTAGSSPHPLLVDLPAGRYGRPRLSLTEGWSKKGVSVVFLNAVDRKSLTLLGLILVVCGFFLANGAFALARARRAEIGTLMTLGWSAGAVFRALLGELALIGFGAGVAGTGLAALLVWVFGLDLSLVRTLLVLPVAVGLACVAGFVPAWRASRASPLDAIRPAIAGRSHRRRVSRLATLAAVNLARLPVRTLVGVAGLAIGVAALTVLLGIQRAFQGTLVGTLLGNAISLQVRGTDLVAIGLTIGLAALSVADVLYLNLRERAAELVTLRTVGWSDATLARLVAWEALALGLLGGLGGAVLGTALGGLLLDVPLGSLAVAAALAGIGGLLVALVASLLPLSQIRRLTPPAVLAAE